ncbi:sugar transferase [Agrococcus sp. KRD186]|uniref:sugar transferase n=1 Tax=Agrococcus sp. KRD186 TaxID=2729730 RepID=UPI0019CFFBEB|nr:sugar transferase [Agrococcus sp. KRD186]
MRNMYARRAKRPLDMIVSGIAVLVFSPLLAAIGVAIKVESRGSVLFSQSRVGKEGEVFRVLKFRSMLDPQQSIKADGTEMTNSERVTNVGRILRRVSLDELPQLCNVWRGEMSLVGPRPALPYQVERYTDQQRVRLTVRPGLTGLAQVSGRNSLTWDEKIALDVEYCRNLTLKTDLRILLRTAHAILSSDGQVFTQHDALSEHGDVGYLKHI